MISLEDLMDIMWNDPAVKAKLCGEVEPCTYESVDLSEVADVKSNRSDCEIVGNICENPELLGEAE